MNDVFISYSSKDRDWVRDLAQALKSIRQEWSISWDQDMPAGQVVDEAIGTAITNARCVLVVWSHNSVETNWVIDEADEAYKLGKLLPVLKENTRPPYGFRRLTAVDLSEWDKSENSQAISMLIRSIDATLTGRSLQPKRERIDVVDYDHLTGLPNRGLFMDRLQQSLARASRAHTQKTQCRIAVMLLDLDGFKEINDIKGHLVGDELLTQVAMRLRKCVRTCDTVARFGGDEFILMFEQLSGAKDAARKAKEIFDGFRKKYVLGDFDLDLSASIGIALYPDDGVEPRSLLMAADQAMYEAKKERSGYQLYNQNIRAAVCERLSWEQDLRQAAKKHEYVLYYQPQIDTRAETETTADLEVKPWEKMDGMEVLLRWMHKGTRIVLPMEFVPFLEKSKLIISVGEWVMRTACEQNKSWQDNGLRALPISVNVSPVQLADDNFIDNVSNILRDTGLESRYLQLEINAETLLANNWKIIHSTLSSLRQLGIRIVLDRFGFGCCPLSRLKDFPVDSVKIEWSLIRGLVPDYRLTAVARSIIDLVKTLQIEAVAVGVESHECLNVLRTFGVNSVQGELFSKPLPPNDFAGLWSGAPS